MKIPSVILSFIILFQSINFDLCDFNKLHNFVVDVNCHLESGESFTEFIADHYSNFSNSHEHKGELHEDEEHGELPFKHQHVEHQIQLVYVFFSTEFESYNDDFVNRTNNFSYEEPSSKLFINNFFQPPRI